MRLLAQLPRAAAVVAAVFAAIATVSAGVLLPDTPDDALVADTWRVVGLATWTAIFVLLAVRPASIPLWAIALASKVALVVVGVVLAGVPGSMDLILWDGLLALVLAGGLVASVTLNHRGDAVTAVDDRARA